jgi:uncharacterized lipoprotein YajG
MSALHKMYYCVGFEVLTAAAMKSLSIAMLAASFLLVSCQAYSLTQKMKPTCSSQTLDDFQWTKWRYILEDKTLTKH